MYKKNKGLWCYLLVS